MEKEQSHCPAERFALRRVVHPKEARRLSGVDVCPCSGRLLWWLGLSLLHLVAAPALQGESPMPHGRLAGKKSFDF